jgi:hypothetical protein
VGSDNSGIDIKRQQMAVAEQAVVLTALAESVARPGCRLLEIGSWCGDSAIVLGEVAKRYGGHLYCIDWWKGNVGTDLEKIAGRSDVYSVFWQRICEGGLEDVIVPIRGRSDEVVNILGAETFDLIYIDGDHRFQSIRNDIAGFAPRVRNGGVLCGDDCEGRLEDFDRPFLEAGKDRDFVESVHCGVVLAVGEAFEHCSIDYNIWSVVRFGESWQPTEVAIPSIPRKRQFPPPLIETYDVYNLVRYGRLVYAIPHASGSVDITAEHSRNRPELLSAESIPALKKKLEDARKALDESKAAPSDPSRPRKVGAFFGFNIVEYQGATYALNRALGPIDLTKNRSHAGAPNIIIGKSLASLIWPIIKTRALRVGQRIFGTK